MYKKGRSWTRFVTAIATVVGSVGGTSVGNVHPLLRFLIEGEIRADGHPRVGDLYESVPTAGQKNNRTSPPDYSYTEL